METMIHVTKLFEEINELCTLILCKLIIYSKSKLRNINFMFRDKEFN